MVIVFKAGLKMYIEKFPKINFKKIKIRNYFRKILRYNDYLFN